MSENFNKNRILKNSVLLYLRMLFTMWINLYTTRLVLVNLGVEDMGVYGVVGSITSLFTVFIGGITNAIQRFITFELGKKNGNIQNVFSTSLNILFLSSIFLLLILEIVGIWVLNNKINIPENSIDTAFWVFQFSIITCLINLISIPYNALVIAHEKMNVFAYISIIQVVLTCLAAYCLSLFENDRLMIYSLVMAMISIFIRIVYQVYCHSKFKEAQFKFYIDRHIIKEIGRYAGVSTISSILQLISNQGITFVINWTFGVVINAVYNIALQLKNSILSFSLNLFKAISPQITKTYAGGEMELHKKLVYTGSKIEVFLIYFIMIPFIFKTEYIMKLWLGEVPEYAIPFAQATVFISITYSAFEPIRTAVLATGNITKFLIIPDCFYVFVLPLGYFIGKLSDNPTYLIISIVVMDIITCIFRIYIASKVSILEIHEIAKKIILPCLYVMALSSLTCYFLSLCLNNTIIDLLTLLAVNSLFLIVIIYFIGLNSVEKNYIKELKLKLKKRFNYCSTK